MLTIYLRYSAKYNHDYDKIKYLMLKKKTPKNQPENSLNNSSFLNIHNSDGHSYYILKIILYNLGKNI